MKKGRFRFLLSFVLFKKTSSSRNKDASIGILSEMGVNFGDGNDSRSLESPMSMSVLIQFPIIPDHVERF